MTKELTVAEISEALGYEIKVVKESTKPYQFKAGDVVECTHYTGAARIRLIVDTGYTAGLTAVDIRGRCKGTCSKQNFLHCGYKKLGELQAFLVK